MMELVSQAAEVEIAGVRYLSARCEVQVRVVA